MHNANLPFVKALTRSEQLITAAMLIFDNDEESFDRYIDWSIAIADEWCFTPELRLAIIDAARENYELGRVLS